MEIPAANCSTCRTLQPVLMLETEDGSFVGCAICHKILNKDEDIKVEYYDAEELHKVSKWKFTEPGA